MPLLLSPLKAPAALPHPTQYLQPVPIPGRHPPVNRQQMQLVELPGRVDGPLPEILPGKEHPADQRLVPRLPEGSSRHSMRGKHLNTGNLNRSKPVPDLDRHNK